MFRARLRRRRKDSVGDGDQRNEGRRETKLQQGTTRVRDQRHERGKGEQKFVDKGGQHLGDQHPRKRNEEQRKRRGRTGRDMKLTFEGPPSHHITSCFRASCSAPVRHVHSIAWDCKPLATLIKLVSFVTGRLVLGQCHSLVCNGSGQRLESPPLFLPAV